MIVVKNRKKLEITCAGCKAELAFELGDLTHMEVGSYDECASGAGVKCPDCGSLTEYKDAPAAIISKLRIEHYQREI